MPETPKSFEEFQANLKGFAEMGIIEYGLTVWNAALASLPPQTAVGEGELTIEAYGAAHDKWRELNPNCGLIPVGDINACIHAALDVTARQAASPAAEKDTFDSIEEAYLHDTIRTLQRELESTRKTTPAAQTAVGEGEHQAKKLYRGRASYDFIKNGEFQADGFAVTVAGHKIAECEDSEVGDWICRQWNVPDLSAPAEEGELPEKWLYQDLEYYAPEVIEPWARAIKCQLRDAIAQRDDRDRHIELAYSALGDVNRSVYLFDHIQKLIAQRDEERRRAQLHNDSAVEAWNLSRKWQTRCQELENGGVMKYPKPWKLELCRLRIDASPTLVEVYDANGGVVLPWGAFDHLDTFLAKRMLAARIVNAVNAQT